MSLVKNPVSTSIGTGSALIMLPIPITPLWEVIVCACCVQFDSAKLCNSNASAPMPIPLFRLGLDECAGFVGEEVLVVGEKMVRDCQLGVEV